MRNYRLFLFTLFTIIALTLPLPTKGQQKDIPIIPKPQSVISKGDVFKLKNNTTILFSKEELKETALYAQTELGLKSKNVKPHTKETYPTNSIVLSLVDTIYKEEGYKLDITPTNIYCTASTKNGIFYAIQSLLQLIDSDKKVSCLTIEDFPQYAWRGFMLDEARHFFGKETVKQYLDLMARLKFNRFHWHLTDEEGWRIEIKSYPRLTTVGAIGNWDDRQAPAQFYTQEDIKEIVEYARQRHIMVIPEIDMPGHAGAATRSYPELSGGGEGRWKGFTYHPAKETTYEFISKVFDEVAALFPAPYIHIGADEVHYGNQSWFTDKTIQKFIKDNYLASEIGLEHYFVRRVCEMIHDKGKKMIGWDEILNTGVTPDKAIVMWWRHDRPNELTNALNKGFQVIMTPRIPCYFDFVQDESHKIGRRWGKNFNELSTVYAFPQSIGNLIEKKSEQVLGMQANIWTERVKDKKRLDFMLFPRLLAIAEDSWTDSNLKDYSDFEQRVKLFLPYLQSLGINYFNLFDKESTPEPWGPQKADVIAEG